MHTDPEAARGSIYGGLIASGWQTATSYMRMLVDRVMRDSHSIGSPGIDNLRWLKPVRPGDTLRGRFTVLDAKPSRSRPEWGIVRSRGEMLNQQDEVVMQVEAVNFFGRRPNGGG
jgi:acyl dehydratase